MCWKYRNPVGTVFIKCDKLNNSSTQSNYLRVFTDCIDDYYDNYNYCPYCGVKLEIKEKLM